MSTIAGVEFVAIGDELVLGETQETNGSWLGQRLAREGIIVRRRTVVGDDAAEIRNAVVAALARCGAVICCGGLGPTPDDKTREAVASLYGWPLEEDANWVQVLRSRFEARGLTMPEVNRVQAAVPRGAVMLPNDVGTAPGLVLENEEHGLVVLLPGVPGELRWLTERHVVPLLRGRLGSARAPVSSRILRTTGLAESVLAERLGGIEAEIAPLTLAFLPTIFGIDLRLTSWGELPAGEAGTALDRAEAMIVERLGAAVYGRDREDLAAVVGEGLRARGLRVAVAESCTGGLLAKRLTDAPGSSDYMLGGLVTYADEAKTELLGVPPALIAEHGAVSEPVARAMLDGVRQRLGADAALSITGIAGPGGGTPAKPVGTVWIGAAVGDVASVALYRLFGSRAEIRERSAQAALKRLLDLLAEVGA